MRHYDIEGAAAVHPFCYVQATDPALDPDNGVTSQKAWFDTLEERVKIRNADNTFWLYLGEEGALL